MIVNVLSNSGKTFEMELSYKKSGDMYLIMDQNGKKRGWIKRIGQDHEVAFVPLGFGSPRKTFKHRHMKQATIQAVEHWNASRQGKVCTVCQEQFDEPLPKYLGSHACEKHANSDWIMTL